MDADLTSRSGGDYDFWRDGLDQGFFKQVYNRAAQVGVAACLLLLGFEQRAIALGLMSGLAVGMFSLWTVEATVRLLFNGGGNAGVKLAIGATVKMPLVLGGLLGIAWAGRHGHLNVFAVIGGVLLVHSTIFLMAIGAAMSNQSGIRQRSR